MRVRFINNNDNDNGNSNGNDNDNDNDTGSGSGNGNGNGNDNDNNNNNNNSSFIWRRMQSVRGALVLRIAEIERRWLGIWQWFEIGRAGCG